MLRRCSSEARASGSYPLDAGSTPATATRVSKVVSMPMCRWSKRKHMGNMNGRERIS